MIVNQFKETCRMIPQMRNKTYIIILSLVVITMIFVLHQILFNMSTNWWNSNLSSNKNYFSKVILTEDLMSTKMSDYKHSINHLSIQLAEHPVLKPFTGEKLIHLDLKGAAPSLSYLKEFFSYIKSLGATGILIEYEDMFPYQGELEGIRASNSYNLLQIGEILKLAENNGLTVIPLIQTFGHFEFVLKLNNYREIREIDEYPQVLCPSHERSLLILQKIIDQILEAHPNVDYIHIGCDEVYYLGKCDRCNTVMKEHNWNRSNLFLNHIKNLGNYISKNYPSVRPIMWADMFAKIDEKLILEYEIPNLVDVMLWTYAVNVSEYLTDNLLDTYARLFKSVWIASAFKGATGASQMITDPKHHLKNHMSWMEIVSKWNKYINFKGIALTGWQRYDHFSVLCELLPVGIPSLTMCLQYLKGSEKEMRTKTIVNALQCDSRTAFSPLDVKFSTSSRCNFPGFSAYQLINKFYVFAQEVNLSFFSPIRSGWFSVYNIVHKFSSPAYVEEIFQRRPFDRYRIQLRYLEEELKKALLEIYDEYTVEEWILTYVTPIQIRLDAIYNARDTALQQKIWPRRPLLNGTNFVQNAANKICSLNENYGCALLI